MIKKLIKNRPVTAIKSFLPREELNDLVNQDIVFCVIV
jgi:hypothetical protein